LSAATTTVVPSWTRFPRRNASALNLLQYLALRRHDLRHVQPQLTSRGLSSLGRTESHVRQSLETVLQVLHVLDGKSLDGDFSSTAITVESGQSLLAAHTDALLGPSPQERGVRIMVTMPSEASADYPLVRDLLAAGMDCMRINCAHDDASAWDRMIHHLDRAKRELKRECRVAMDLAGPKLRTGPIEPGPTVLKVKPRRDAHGRVTKPAVVALVPVSKLRAPDSVDAVLPIDGDLPAVLAIGDAIEFDDARGRSRRMIVRARDGARSSPSSTGRLHRVRHGPAIRRLRRDVGEAHCRCPADRAEPVPEGDTLLLTPDSLPGGWPSAITRGACTAGEHRHHTPGGVQGRAGWRPIWFDDGKIGGVVRDVAAEQIVVEITQARPKGRSWPREGHQSPDTRLRLAALTAKDTEDLAFVAAHADLVAYSFVRQADDVHQLRHRLAELHAERLGSS
jgi:pyruvate kinase